MGAAARQRRGPKILQSGDPTEQTRRRDRRIAQQKRREAQRRKKDKQAGRWRWERGASCPHALQDEAQRLLAIDNNIVEVHDAGRGKGRGLFVCAGQTVRCGEHICYYLGRYYGSRRQLEEARRARDLAPSMAVLRDDSGRYVDGDDPDFADHAGRAVNYMETPVELDSTGAPVPQRRVQGPNAEYRDMQGVCVLEALRDIREGEEVTIDYGDDYRPKVALRDRCVF
jgi:hypothetical protein